MARRLTLLSLTFALLFVAGCTRTSVDTDPSRPEDEMAVIKGEKSKKMATGIYGTLVVETIDGRPAVLVLQDMVTQEKIEGRSKYAKQSYLILEAVVDPGARCISAKWVTHQDSPSISSRDDKDKLIEEQISSSMCFNAAAGVTYRIDHAEERGTHYFWVAAGDSIVAGFRPDAN